MRAVLSTAVIAGFLLVAGAVHAAPNGSPRGQQFAANAAGSYAAQTAYTGPQLDVGYSASTRRIADCLASFRGYNPKTDKVWSRTGPPQRCKL
jgi:hypothetical protein